jgi:excinuclease ABC subunit A
MRHCLLGLEHTVLHADELARRDFSFNNPYGACPDCKGLGSRLEADPQLVVPDGSLTLEEGAIKFFFTGMQNYYPSLVRAAVKHLGSSMDIPWDELPKKVREALLSGLGDTRVKVEYVTRDGWRRTGTRATRAR